MRKLAPVRRAFTLIEMMLVVVILGIIVAVAVPSLLGGRVAANEASAAGTLRSMVATQSTLRQTDSDRNGISDWWTADVSGFYRIESQAVPGLGIALMDQVVAEADDAKEGNGAAVGGAPLPPPSTTSAAGLIAMVRSSSKSGYRFRGMPGFRSDPDGNAQSWTNSASFGFQARPEIYYSTGIQTIIVNEAGVIYARDFGDNNPANADAWPGANPTSAGWKVVQ